MALMYTDIDGFLQGILRDVSFDADIGDGNDFLLTIPKNLIGLLGKGCRVFDSENAEFGGMIDGMEVDTSADSVSFTGKTWFGLLEQKIIVPPSGQTYKTSVGSTTHIMGELINEHGLNDYFNVPYYDPEIQGQGEFTFDRFSTLLDGIMDLLSSSGKVLSAKYNLARKKIDLTARDPVDYSTGEGFIRSPFNYKIKKQLKPVNHVIALGRGQGSSRTVVHLFLQSNGEIGTTQYFFGTDEVTFLYDNTNAESKNDLTKQAKKKFEEIIEPTVEINVASGENYYIGDKIGGYEPITKTIAVGTVKSLILQINGDKKTISYNTERRKNG